MVLDRRASEGPSPVWLAAKSKSLGSDGTWRNCGTPYLIRVVPSGIHSLFAATPAMRCRSRTVSSSAAPPDRAPVCTIHDTEHRASLYALLRDASFSADSRRRFRLFT